MAIGMNKFGAKAGVSLASSLLVLTSVIATQSALAQDDADDMVEEVIVQGTRQSLMNAQDIKREADTFVDAISASDIGSLPDRSVLEAMQRLPGVSIERFAAKNDPDHFSAEGSGAVVRGMTATRTEFNGRDSFTANSGRGLSFQDVPPELMSSVKLYKNQSADMIEGGIGGTVSLYTRLPFDQDGQVFSISADATYYDLNEKTAPSFSGLYSNSWDLESGGEFGFLIGMARSKSDSRSDGIQSEIFQSRVFNGQDVLVPNGSNVTMKEDNRIRNGLNVALQWANADETILATATYLKSDSSLAWNENKISYQGGVEQDGVANLYETTPMEGTTFAFDDDGVFTRGVLANGGGWRAGGNDNGRIAAGRQVVTSDDGVTALDSIGIPLSTCSDADLDNDPDNCNARVDVFGNKFQTTSRVKHQRTIVEDYAFNLKFTPNEDWEIVVDYQFVDASTSDDDMELFLGMFAMQDFDITGDVPTLALVNPWSSATQETIDNLSQGNDGTKTGRGYFADPASYYWKAAMDHYERAVGDEHAGRLDVTRFFEDSFITKVQAGVRTSVRDQEVRYSRYNWDQLSELFDGGSGDPDGDGYNAGWLDLPATAELANDYELVDWGSFNRGGVFTVPGAPNNMVMHPSRELTEDYANWGDRLASITLRDSAWVPASQRDEDNDGQYDTIGHFTPSEFSSIEETNNAAYVRFDFETELAGMRYQGNFGLRYFEITSKSAGFIQFPDLTPDITDTADPGYLQDVNNWLSADESGFGNLATEYSETVNTYDDLLPSFNMKVEITDDLLARVAISKAVALPDIGKLRNYMTIGLQDGGVQRIIAVQGSDYDENDTIQEEEIISASVTGWQASAGNPFLLPMESIQYDLSLEWYFADVGSLTGSLFYKDLSNFFVDGAFPRNVTNQSSGVTQPVNVSGTINSGDGTMSGFELAYQQFYDFLPAPWDGFGIQANYTFIDAKNVPNPGIADGSAVIATFEDREGREGQVTYGGLPLESQSKHTANFVAMYEKEDWSIRLAYNWRSRYLVTARDVINPYRPIWSDAAGYLDASIFYNLTDNVKVGFQGQNLSNTVVKTQMQITEGGYTQGRSWFTNDRRYAFIVRATF